MGIECDAFNNQFVPIYQLTLGSQLYSVESNCMMFDLGGQYMTT